MYSVLIRPLLEEDANTSFQWRNDPEVWKFTGHKPDKYITYEIELEWIQNVLKRSNEIRFAICIQDSGKYIGNVQLTNINGYDAEFHIFIGDKSYWGKGIAKEATFQILTYAKKVLKLKSVFLDVNKENLPAIKSYKKNSFVIINETNGFIRMVCDLSV